MITNATTVVLIGPIAPRWVGTPAGVVSRMRTSSHEVVCQAAGPEATGERPSSDVRLGNPASSGRLLPLVSLTVAALSWSHGSTHVSETLLDLVGKRDVVAASKLSDACELTPYGVDVRYPTYLPAMDWAHIAFFRS
jgi:hypothetical protein